MRPVNLRRDDELSCGATGCRCVVHTPNTILNAKEA